MLWIRSIARLRLGWHGLHPNAWYPQDKLSYSTRFYFQLGNKGLTPATRARTHTQTHAGFTNEWGDEELTTCQTIGHTLLGFLHACWCPQITPFGPEHSSILFISRGDQCLNMDIASWHLCHNGDCDWPLRQMSCPWACTPNPDRWDQVGPGGTGHWWITCQVSKLGAPQRLGQLSTANCSYLHYILLILHIEHRGARSCAQCFVNTSARRLEESLAQVLPLALLSYKFYTSIGAVYGSLWQFGIIFPSLEQNIPKLNGNSAISATL